MSRKVGGNKKIDKLPNLYKIGDSVVYKGQSYKVSFAEDGLLTLENVGTYLFVIVEEKEL